MYYIKKIFFQSTFCVIGLWSSNFWKISQLKIVKTLKNFQDGVISKASQKQHLAFQRLNERLELVRVCFLKLSLRFVISLFQRPPGWKETSFFQGKSETRQLLRSCPLMRSYRIANYTVEEMDQNMRFFWSLSIFGHIFWRFLMMRNYCALNVRYFWTKAFCSQVLICLTTVRICTHFYWSWVV